MKRSDYIELKKDLLLYEKILLEKYKKKVDKETAKKGLRKTMKEEMHVQKVLYDMQLRKKCRC